MADKTPVGSLQDRVRRGSDPPVSGSEVEGRNVKLGKRVREFVWLSALEGLDLYLAAVGIKLDVGCMRALVLRVCFPVTERSS